MPTIKLPSFAELTENCTGISESCTALEIDHSRGYTAFNTPLGLKGAPYGTPSGTGAPLSTRVNSRGACKGLVRYGSAKEPVSWVPSGGIIEENHNKNSPEYTLSSSQDTRMGNYAPAPNDSRLSENGNDSSSGKMRYAHKRSKSDYTTPKKRVGIPVDFDIESFSVTENLMSQIKQEFSNDYHVTKPKVSDTKKAKFETYNNPIMVQKVEKSIKVLEQVKHIIQVGGRPERRKRRSFSGDFVSLKVNAGVGHVSEYGKGGLNTVLSLRQDVVCHQCDAKETPEWRRGPAGLRTLCNACGLFYSKLIRRFGPREAEKVMMERREAGMGFNRNI